MLENFISIKGLNRDKILSLIELSNKFENGNIGFYGNKFESIVFLFQESCTRTLLSFKMACQRFGVNFIEADYSKMDFNDSESMFDVLSNIQALGVGAIVLKSNDHIAINIATDLGLKVINAGIGEDEQPSQALLDAVTIFNHFGSLDKLRIQIIGDIIHSKAAKSLMDLLNFFDSDVELCMPPELGVIGDTYPNVSMASNSTIFQGCDIYYVLRNQVEKHDFKFIDPENYFENYGLNNDRLKNISSRSIILHPEPINREIEISSEVMSDKRVKTLEQTKNGVYTKMAILKEVLNG